MCEYIYICVCVCVCVHRQTDRGWLVGWLVGWLGFMGYQPR